jgi:putative peptide zinc metalloprotease protein
MRYGPTSLQISSVLAKGLRRPKLREDLKISEQQVSGKASYVIKDPDTLSYNRYGPTEYELLTLCDGTRTPAEVAQEMSERHPDTPLDESSVLDFLDTVDANLWVRTVGEKNLAVLERIRDERKGRAKESSLLYIQFKAWEPNKTLEWLDRYFGWMYTRTFAIGSIVAFFVAASLWVDDWTRIQQDTEALYSFAGKSSYDIWTIWIIMMLVGGIHELGHGLTCKHFGGEVPQMGFMLIYFTPAFYTDTTDILIFDTAAPRLLTIFAGIWVELIVCVIATFIWALTLPGTIVNDLAYKTLIFSGVMSIALNFNPLIKADGYYALAQYVQIDSLREDSLEYVKVCAQKYILRRKVELPAASSRQRRIFLVFGVAAVLYAILIFYFVATFVLNIFVSKLGNWGYAFFGVGVYLLMRGPVQRSIPTLRAWYWKTREAYMKWKITRSQKLAAAGVALLLVVPPFSAKVSSEFVLEPGLKAEIRPPAAGTLISSRVRNGEVVNAGEVLAQLENPALVAQAADLNSQLGAAESAVRVAEQRGSQGDIARVNEERERIAGELAITRARLTGLTLRAPFSGTVMTGEQDPKPGDYIPEGEDFVRLVDRSKMRARILVHDWEFYEVKVGAPAQLKVAAYPLRTYDGRIDRILPAAASDLPLSQLNKLERHGQEISNYFAVEMSFQNQDGSLVEGMTGVAKITGKRRPYIWRAADGLWRWVHSQIW